MEGTTMAAGRPSTDMAPPAVRSQIGYEVPIRAADAPSSAAPGLEVPRSSLTLRLAPQQDPEPQEQQQQAEP